MNMLSFMTNTAAKHRFRQMVGPLQNETTYV